MNFFNLLYFDNLFKISSIKKCRKESTFKNFSMFYNVDESHSITSFSRINDVTKQ